MFVRNVLNTCIRTRSSPLQLIALGLFATLSFANNKQPAVAVAGADRPTVSELE